MEAGYLENAFNLDEVSGNLERLFPDFEIDFGSFLEHILAGDLTGAARALMSSLRSGILAQAGGMRNLFLALLLIGMLSALLTVLTKAFKNQQLMDMAHFIAYLMMQAVVLAAYLQAAEITRELLERMLLFVRLFVPTFMLALGLSAGTATAVGYYELILLLIYGVEQILVSVGLPVIHIYMILVMMDGIWEEKRMDTLLDLAQKGVKGALKFLLACVTGIGLLQSMITPVLEQLKLTAASKALSAIPGLGGLAEGTAQMLLGSAVLVKNGLGVAAVLLLSAFCIIPFVKLLLYGSILRLSAGLLELSAEKRLTGCVGGAGDALFLLLRISYTAGACFLILFAIITCLAGTAGR